MVLGRPHPESRDWAGPKGGTEGRVERMPDEDVIVEVEVATVRRWAGIGTFTVLGLLLLWIALAQPPASLALRVSVLVAGIAAVVLAVRMRGATERALVLTPTELRESGAGGRRLAALRDVASIDRGAFAFKPSHGFLLHLKAGAGGGRAWAPGLWWRIGDRVGVGGVLRASEARFLAEAIALRLER